MEIKPEFGYKGTRILFGETAKKKSDMLQSMRLHLLASGYKEIIIPVIQKQETFKDKVGDNKNLMFNFTDRKDRELCLAPEYTAICQQLAKTTFKHDKNLKVFYIVECFRGEKPQKGRYRQFTQLGVEILNPTEDYAEGLQGLAKVLLNNVGITRFKLTTEVKRGLDYYTEGKGFEIEAKELGSQKQICGGGAYENGCGFALGIDRLLELNK